MTGPPITTAATHRDPAGTPGRSRAEAFLSGLRRFARIAVRGVLVEPISEGRMRRVNWPYGWWAVLVVGHLALVLAAGIALTARLWRSAPLAEVGSSSGLLPRPSVWVLGWLLLTVAALFHTAAMRCSWWVRVISLVIMLALMGGWLATLLGIGALASTGLAVLAVLAMLIYTLVRIARPAQWWDFAAYWLLLSVPVLITMVANRSQASLLGFDLPPVVITQTMTLLALLCTPVAVAAGTTVAELAVSASVWSAVAAGRVSRRPVLLIAVAVALVARGVQAGFEVAALDWSGAILLVRLLPVLVAALVLGALSALLVRRAGRVLPQVTELPDRLGDLGLPIGVALLGVLLPYNLLLVGVQFWVGVTGTQPDGRVWNLLSGDEAGSVTRGILAVALLVLAFRAAGRGRIASALLQAHIAVFLLPRPLAALTGASVGLWPDVDLLNLLLTTLALGVLVVGLATHSLTNSRLIALGAVIVLSLAFSGRDILLSPVLWLLGPSAALLLVGLVWTLLTEAGGCNVDGRRFPASARAAMMIGFVTLAAVVLAYDTLSGAVGTGGLDIAESVGDEILGTALLTATVSTLLALVRRDLRPH